VFDETLIAEAGRRLLEAAPPGTRVILFGSHARGDAGKYSDLDFLVIEPSVDDVIDESVRLRRTLRGLGVCADVIVVSEREAEELVGIDEVSDAIIGFHAQQAVEKSLKAVLAFRGVDYPYSHDIDGLIELSQNNGIEVPQELPDADHLSPFSVGALYGGPEPTHVDRDRALAWATTGVEWAGGLIHG
jgi:HEPN domain-containing protein/predicted nucleotidyltransferase